MIILALLLCLFLPIAAHAQSGAQRIPTCGQGEPGPGTSPTYMDANGNLCVTGALAGTINTKSAPLTALAGTQTLTLTTTAQALTVPTGATSATLSVTGGAAVYRDDGTAPTATVGMTLPVGLWTYVGPLSAVKFILPTGVTGTVVTVAFYQ